MDSSKPQANQARNQQASANRQAADSNQITASGAQRPIANQPTVCERHGLEGCLQAHVPGADPATSEAIEVASCIARTLGNYYFAIYHIWMKEGTYVCFREGLEDLLESIGVHGTVPEAFDLYISTYVEPEDRDDMRAFADFFTLADRLARVNALSHEYRRIGIGWTRGEFIVSRRDEQGAADHVVFVVTDINMEKNLVAREARATFSSEHDVLTGALNRTAFERALSTNLYAGEPVGFAIVDIDGLKDMNDESGHGFGDEVISKVASALMSAFRADDKVFRIGGDEFAVLLKGCDASCWSALCEKMERIHRSLSVSIPEDDDVTVSVGACFGEDGLQEWMYETADKGLYHTKENGRAGCTLVDRSGKVLDSWRDDDASIRPIAALASGNAGAGRIEFPHDPDVSPRFYCGKALMALYGIPEGLSPEERYAFWVEGVDSSYLDVLAAAHKRMLTKTNVECTFRWGRPGQEPFVVRAVGSGRDGETMDVIYGVHRSLSGATIIEKRDDSELIVAAQNGVYGASYYVDLAADTISVLKQTEEAARVDVAGLGAQEALGRIMGTLVDADFRTKVQAFVDLGTLSERLGSQHSIDCEALTLTSQGWCRFSWLPVKRNAQGCVTHALYVVASIDAAKEAEIVKDRETAQLMGLHYEAAQMVVNSKIMDIALIDYQTGLGRAWTSEKHYEHEVLVNYADLAEFSKPYMASDECDAFIAALDFAKVKEEVARNGSYAVPAHICVKGVDRYIVCHFSRYKRDTSKLLKVTEDVTAAHQEQGRSVEDLFNNVPGALVTYEWTGEEYEALRMSDYYLQLFGTDKASFRAGAGVDFDWIHPDDVEGYRQHVADVLPTAHEAHWAYRVWDEKRGGYSWVKIDAVAKEDKEGRLLVYALYSDVTELMRVKRSLERADVSLARAMEASGQIGFEFDLVTRTVTRYTSDSGFALPERIEHAPESLVESGVLHADDAEKLIAAVRSIDEGQRHAQCDVRLRRDGEYRWCSCLFDRQEGAEGEHDYAAVLVMDITMRIMAMKSFEDRVESLLYANDNALSIGIFNVTKGTVDQLRAQDGVFSRQMLPLSYEDALAGAAAGIRGQEDRQKYLSLFSREHFKELVAQGETHVSMECFYTIEPGRTEWVEISSDFMINPETSDIEAVGYTRVVTELRLAGMLTNDAVRDPMSSSSVLLDDGDEYYMFDNFAGANCSHRTDFWGDLSARLAKVCDEGEIGRIAALTCKDGVLAALERDPRPSVAFYAWWKGVRYRLQLVYSVLDQQRGLILVQVQNITDKMLDEQIRRDARLDRLTGLYNRQTAFAECRNLLDAHPDEHFIMMKLNVRRFRMYNEFFGEEAGDDLLCTIADGLRELSADYPYGVYGRIEADVFCAFFPRRKGVLTRHVEIVKQRFKDYRSDFLLEPSMGIYEVADRDLPIEAMFARATTAAKEGGRVLSRGVHCYNESLERELEEEIAITNQMQHALDTRQFVVYLQPKYQLQTGKRSGAEALVRWVHPERGLIPPAAFIPVFESNGFITSLDQYMWEHTCQLIRKWLDQGRDVMPISVNVSRVSAYSPATVPFLIELVKRYDIDPSLMELELTESAYIGEPEKIKRTLRDLRAAGFRVLMDDFGSGYSSLNTLRDLPLDIVKLDRGFMTDACKDERGRVVLSSVISMAQQLHLPVVAEGVETQEQADYLRSLNCECVQGFLFARPMPVEEYEKLD